MATFQPIIMTAGELRKLRVWHEICKRNQWEQESIDMISDDMHFRVSADLLGEVSKFIIMRKGKYLMTFNDETGEANWTDKQTDALVFKDIQGKAIQKSFDFHHMWAMTYGLS